MGKLEKIGEEWKAHHSEMQPNMDKSEKIIDGEVGNVFRQRNMGAALLRRCQEIVGYKTSDEGFTLTFPDHTVFLISEKQRLKSKLEKIEQKDQLILDIREYFGEKRKNA